MPRLCPRPCTRPVLAKHLSASTRRAKTEAQHCRAAPGEPAQLPGRKLVSFDPGAASTSRANASPLWDGGSSQDAPPRDLERLGFSGSPHLPVRYFPLGCGGRSLVRLLTASCPCRPKTPRRTGDFLTWRQASRSVAFPVRLGRSHSEARIRPPSGPARRGAKMHRRILVARRSVGRALARVVIADACCSLAISTTL